MKFKVTIENFEGPIDALLQMIEKRKMPISDVSLSDITDEYIHFIRNLESESLSNTTHFIFVASTLTLIKSKSLLPNLELSEDEEGDIEDLKRRIALFQIYQEAAQNLKQYYKTKKTFYYPKPAKRSIVFTPHKDLDIDILVHSLQNIFSEIPQKQITKKEASIRIAIHIDEMMSSLEMRIKTAIQTNFKSFMKDQIGDKKDQKAIKVYNVVGFLAMLELVKNRALDVMQDVNFDTINMSSAEKQTALD